MIGTYTSPSLFTTLHPHAIKANIPHCGHGLAKDQCFGEAHIDILFITVDSTLGAPTTAATAPLSPQVFVTANLLEILGSCLALEPFARGPNGGGVFGAR